ncbi:MAG: PAS domain-containing protein [Candidatus Phaeomarinobacter sp.]
MSAAALKAPESPLCLSERSLAFLAYWKEARGRSALPSPEDIRPSELTELLPYLRYMRWDGPERVVFRLWGTGLAELMKTDLTGLNVFDMLPERERETERVRLKNLHLVPCGFAQQRRVTDVSGVTRLFEFLTLPVSAGSDGQPRMIGPGSFVDAVPGERVELADDPKTVIHSFTYLDLGFGIPE